MAIDLTTKQSGFVNRHNAAVASLLSLMDQLRALKAEWDANAYATGANPTTNNITDAVVQGTAPYMDAAKLNQAIGAVVTIGGTVDANRGYLEALRP